ncbi:MAG: hypothetical protein U5K56_05100 [Halioglobus sp.]|nr:hypothetical protein [Halioglobus sp.]
MVFNPWEANCNDASEAKLLLAITTSRAEAGDSPMTPPTTGESPSVSPACGALSPLSEPSLDGAAINGEGSPAKRESNSRSMATASTWLPRLPRGGEAAVGVSG